ncbi:MAG: tyrosine-type recombinase/integrase, partial [Chloroflexota bacterium]|nr:tyrosine-type recombinase/integrase [Chloroflexota bacterium]
MDRHEQPTTMIVPKDGERFISQKVPFPSVDDVLAGQLTASSIAMYRRDVAAYRAYAEAYHKDALSSQTLAEWRDELAMHTTMSPNTINRMMSAVKRLIKEAARPSRRMLPAALHVEFQEVPGVKVKALKGRLKQNSRTRITPEDMRRLCEMPDTTTLIGIRDAALLATLASSGLRASELASLKQEQIQQRGRGYYLQIIGKTDVEPRDAHLSVEAYSRIHTWLAQRPLASPYIFTSFATRACIPNAEPISEVTV